MNQDKQPLPGVYKSADIPIGTPVYYGDLKTQTISHVRLIEDTPCVLVAMVPAYVPVAFLDEIKPIFI